MAIEYDFQEIKLANKVVVGATQATIECVIDTQTKGGISKILSLCGDVKCKGAVCEDANVKVDGVFNCKVICLNLDGQFASYDYNCDFTASIPNKTDNCYEQYITKACILDMDSAINGDKISIQAVCDISASASESREVRFLTSVSGNIFAKEDDECIAQTVGKVSHSFAVVDEYESGVNIDKVLLFDYDAIGCSMTIIDDMITLNGEIGATVVYESKSTITTKSFLLPFCEEISIPNCKIDRAKIKVHVTSAKIILGGSEDNNIMRLEFGLDACGMTYMDEKYNVISDVYSTSNELTTLMSTEKYYEYKTTVCVKEKIAGSAEIAEQMNGVRRVLSCCASRNCITNIFAGDDCFTVEGVLAASVIYEDSNTDIDSMQIELPYSLPFDNDKVDSDDRLCAEALVEILSVKVKRDREIEITALITLQVDIEECESLKCITELVVGEEKQCEDNAITIYQTRPSEDIWDIAKAVGASISELMSQNASLKDGVGRGQKVSFYRQLIG